MNPSSSTREGERGGGGERLELGARAGGCFILMSSHKLDISQARHQGTHATSRGLGQLMSRGTDERAEPRS